MDTTITFGPLSAKKGEKVQGMVPVYDTGLTFPLTIINGEHEGKRVYVSGGLHSCEYCGIVAAMELAWALTPEDIHGALIIAHPLNRTGMEAAIPEIIPMDGKNLNRVFPGDRNGTATEQFAHAQSKEFHANVDAYIDLHCGEVHDQLTPYVYHVGNATPEIVEASRAAAAMVDVPYMVSSQARTGAYNSAGLTGTISILLERGWGGQWDREKVDAYKKDVRNVLRHLGVLVSPEEPRKHTPKDLVNLVYLDSEKEGCFFPAVDAGDPLEKGQLIGELKDYFGNVIDRFYSEYGNGVVLYRTSKLYIQKGGGVICYGQKVE